LLFMADKAHQQRAADDDGSAILLAREALPDSAAGIDRHTSPRRSCSSTAPRAICASGSFFGEGDAVVGAAFSPDGQRIVTASSDKRARVWDAFPDPQALVARCKAAVPRCLTSAQPKAFFLPPQPLAWCIEMEKWPYDSPV
jgi:WD40 repeat protein